MAKRKSEKTQAPVNQLVGDLLSMAPDVPPFIREYPFAPGRQWAFDVAWPDLMVACEYEGNTWVPGESRHTTGIGYHADVIKYNEAAVLGWSVIRVTADMLRDGTYVNQLYGCLLRAMRERHVPETSDEPGEAKRRLRREDIWARAEVGGV